MVSRSKYPMAHDRKYSSSELNYANNVLGLFFWLVFVQQNWLLLCDVPCNSPDVITADTIKVVAERVHDKSVSFSLLISMFRFLLFILICLIYFQIMNLQLVVKCYTMERLADIYKLYSQRDSSTNSDDFEWVLGKILRCLYEKYFR